MSAVAAERRGALTRRAALASTAAALFLLGLKAWAARETGSVAMLGSLADTGLDLVASLVTLFAVRLAALPADHDHRFGHGKAEAIAALVQVGIILVSASLIAWRAGDRLVAGTRATAAEEGIAVSLVAIATTLLLVAYQRSVVRRTGSVAIDTDRLHYQGDLFLNLAVIAALALDRFAQIPGIDALTGLAIALWLLRGAWAGGSRAVDQLMDREWPEERRRRFVEVAARHPAGLGIHDLRTRSSGTRDFAQFHIWLDGALTVHAMHDVVEEIETELAREFPGVEVLIHVDPEGQVDQPDNPLAEHDETQGLQA